MRGRKPKKKQKMNSKKNAARKNFSPRKRKRDEKKKAKYRPIVRAKKEKNGRLARSGAGERRDVRSSPEREKACESEGRVRHRRKMKFRPQMGKIEKSTTSKSEKRACFQRTALVAGRKRRENDRRSSTSKASISFNGGRPTTCGTNNGRSRDGATGRKNDDVSRRRRRSPDRTAREENFKKS